MVAVVAMSCRGDEPPFFCQTPLSEAEWQERGELLRAAMQQARAKQPKRCPACDSTQITPTFDDDIWQCGACGQPFDVRG